MKKIFLFLLILIVLLPISIATYQNIGNTGGDFRTGDTQFSSALDEWVLYSRNLADGRDLVRVFDLDGDGDNEIIVLDSDQLMIYENKTLNLRDSISIGSVDAFTSPMELNDWDGDGITEIIFSVKALGQIRSYNWDGTSITNDRTMDINFTYESGKNLIKCNNAGNCVLIVTDRDDVSTTIVSNRLIAGVFNFTRMGNETLFEQANGRGYCFSQVPLIQAVDWDFDGNDNEFVFSYYRISLSGSESVRTQVFRINDTNIMDAIEQIDVFARTEIQITAVAGDKCEDLPARQYLTSPLTADFDANPGNGLETVMGYQVDANNFYMILWKSTGTIYNQHPNLVNADGTIMSNVFRGNFFPDTEPYGDVDYCVLGWENVTKEIEILCGSQLVNFFTTLSTHRYQLPTLGSNVSHVWNEYNIASHTINADQTIYEGVNLDDVWSPWGTLRLDWDSCVVGFCDLDLLFGNLLGDTAMILADPEGSGYDDVIGIADNFVGYLDDAFENSPGYITNVSFNPCPEDTIWEENTTVLVTVKVSDANGDKVQANLSAYVGDSNEKNLNWSVNVTPLTPIAFTFTADKQIDTGVIRVYARDTENQDTLDLEEFTFIVKGSGIGFNDQTCTYDNLAPGEGEIPGEDIQTGLNETNILTTAMDDLVTTSGLGSTILWLLIMVIITIFIWMQSFHDAITPMIVIGVVNLLLLIIGVSAGFISFGILWAIIVVCIILIGFWITKFWHGQTIGGNGGG